jgi:hypothetical protein
MENKKILCNENIDLIDNEFNKETKDKNDKIILPIKILINPSQIEESKNNKYIKENKIKINNNKDFKSSIDIKKPFSQNFSCKSKNVLLGKKRKNKISNLTNNQKKENSRKINAVKNAKIKTINNSIELINNFPGSNHENKNKLNIPHDLSFRLCKCEEKKENKKLDIVEKIRKSIDKAKNESSSKKINKLWINWINEVIASSNEKENEINNISENKLYTNKSSTNLQLKSDKISKMNEDLKKNREHDCISCIRNIAKIKTNNGLFG